MYLKLAGQRLRRAKLQFAEFADNLSVFSVKSDAMPL